LIGQEQISINLELSGQIEIGNIIKTTISELNKKFEIAGKNKRLSYQYEKYQFKPAKKSGKPDNDLPSKYFFLM
jgi:hypothetical protein